MKSQQLFKKYPIAISAGAAFIIFAALAIFRSGSAGDLRAELSSREVDASRLSENLHNAQRLPAQLDEMDSLTKHIAERLSSPNDVANNQQYFYKLEADSGVKLSDLHQIAAPAKSAKVKYTQYSVLIYAVSVQGDFAHQLAFLRNLESGARLSAITNAAIGFPPSSKAGEDLGPGAMLQMTLTVQLLCTP